MRRLTLGLSAATFASQGLSLAVNLLSGVLVARVLGAHGRGELVAILTATQLVAWVWAMGSSSAASYYQAQHPERSAQLLGTWLSLVLPLSLAAVATGELVLPAIFGAQTDATLDLARVYMAAVGVFVYTEFIYGFMLGAGHFLYFNVARVAIPAATAAGYLVLWAADALTVKGAVAITAGVNLVAVAITTACAVRWHGLARPSREVARSTLWYGLRAHSGYLTGALNTRLDLFIMPAFLAASQVGLYSVATNVSWIVAIVPGSLGLVVLPLAARGGDGGPQTVVRSLHVALAAAGAMALVLVLLAGPLVRLVYGDAFQPAVSALRILLPGSVLYAGTFVLVSGLSAVNRPFTGGLAQAIGVVVTTVGLILFLADGGIDAAALISTIAYGLGFGFALVLYRRAVALPWHSFLPHRGSPAAQVAEKA